MKPAFKTLDYLYIHTSGAGNAGHITVVTTKRTYVAKLAAASANTIQFVQGESLQRAIISLTVGSAAGGVELSRASTSQFANSGTATQDVLGRVQCDPLTTSGLPHIEAIIEWQ